MLTPAVQSCYADALGHKRSGVAKRDFGKRWSAALSHWPAVQDITVEQCRATLPSADAVDEAVCASGSGSDKVQGAAPVSFNLFGVNGGIIKRVPLLSHRIWTWGWAPRSNPMRNQRYPLYNTLIHSPHFFLLANRLLRQAVLPAG